MSLSAGHGVAVAASAARIVSFSSRKSFNMADVHSGAAGANEASEVASTARRLAGGGDVKAMGRTRRDSERAATRTYSLVAEGDGKKKLFREKRAPPRRRPASPATRSPPAELAGSALPARSAHIHRSCPRGSSG